MPKVLVVHIETPCGSYTETTPVEDDWSEKDIEEMAKDLFSNICNYGYHVEEDFSNGAQA